MNQSHLSGRCFNPKSDRSPWWPAAAQKDTYAARSYGEPRQEGAKDLSKLKDRPSQSRRVQDRDRCWLICVPSRVVNVLSKIR